MSVKVDALTVLAIIDLLRAHPEGVGLDDLARRFDYSTEDMRSLIFEIWTLGVKDETGYDDPGGMFEFDSDAFEEEDWIVLTHDPVRTTPVRYTPSEHATVLLGLEVLRASATVTERPHIDAVIAKLRGESDAVGLATDAELSEQLPATPAASRHDDPFELALDRAIREHLRVRIQYRSEHGASADWRTIEPLRIVTQGASSYVNAWCRTRDEMRWFRLDRIRDLEATDETADPHTEEERERALDVRGRNLTDVELLVGAAAWPSVRPYFKGKRIPEPGADGYRRVKTALVSWRIAARLVAENAGEVTVLSPQHVRDAVVAWAGEARAALDETPADSPLTA